MNPADGTAAQRLPEIVTSGPDAGAKAAIFIQDACLNHQFIRSRDVSQIIERPERIRAVKVGIAATLAHLEDLVAVSTPIKESAKTTSTAIEDRKPTDNADDLATVLDRMTLVEGSTTTTTTTTASPLRIIQSSASVDILNNLAVKYVHGDIDKDIYLQDLVEFIAKSQANISEGKCEIPEHWARDDLYLCPGSLSAIQGAIGTVCEAVDAVVHNAQNQPPSESGSTRAFCAIRPPGHHCGEDTPSGFCFANNVAIGAAHAHLKHGINRVIILDIDLHHGNGTQSIIWQINEETYRRTLEDEQVNSSERPGLQVYFGSMHDILSFPCEDGKAQFIQAASVSIHGHHGQHIENVHILPWKSEEEFFTKLYEGSYSKLLSKAQEFVQSTGDSQDDVLVFISCGFDASEHEFLSMSRHDRKVPVEFYHRFTRDVCTFADKFAKGKVVSVLEGGYSDRALTSGTIAHISALVDTDAQVAREWWNEEHLDTLEKAAKKKGRGGRPSATKVSGPWIERAMNLLGTMEARNVPKFSPPMSMTLRDKKKNENKAVSTGSSRIVTPVAEDREAGNTEVSTESVSTMKKLPRVILKLGPPPAATT